MNNTMEAAVLYGARDLRVESRSRPVRAQGMVVVRVRRAGVCGSDIHYYGHGRCGGFVPRGAFVLGHELTGEVADPGEASDSLPAGTRVVVNPARACLTCEYCSAGRRNLCPNTIMLGSASTVPPTDGAFAEFVTVRADQCLAISAEIDDGEAAMIEPLAVALEAVKKPGKVAGKRVLVTGAGPIGLLVGMVAKAYGAVPVALSDVVASRRVFAEKFVDLTIDPASTDLRDTVRAAAGYGFDVVFEASGSPAALRQAFNLVRPGGSIVQIGTISADEVPLPANQIMSREINVLGSFRYGDVFEEAIRLVAHRRVQLGPLITSVMSLRQADRALQQASAKDGTVKVQLTVP